MKGNTFARPPQPPLSTREKRLIDLLIDDGSRASDQCMADILNNCYPEDNNRARSRDGVYKYRRRHIEEINTLRAMV